MKMDFGNRKPSCFHLADESVEAADLFPSKRDILRFPAVSTAKMSENPLYMQVFHLKKLLHAIQIVSIQAQPMHPAVDGDMNGNRDFLAVQFFRIRKVDECLRESIGFQLLCPANVGKPENQDLTPDSVAAKRNALINGGDGEGLYPGFFQVSGNGIGTVAVGLTFDNAHKLGIRRQGSFQDRDIVREVCKIELDVSPVFFRIVWFLKTEPQPERGHRKAEKKREQAHETKVKQAVLRGKTPHRRNHQRMNEIDNQRGRAEKRDPSAFPQQNQVKQKVHGGQQKHIHAVVALKTMSVQN